MDIDSTDRELELKEELIQGCQVLNDQGITDEQGHLSTRTRDDENVIWINKSISPKSAGVRDFVQIDLDEDIPADAPSEAVLHTEIYRERDDVNAICHNHSPFAVTVSSVGLEMRPVHHVGAVQTDPIDVYDNYHSEGGMLITTTEEGQDIAELLGDDRAVVLRGHGLIITGTSITETVLASIKVEYNARLLYLQSTIGEPWYLPSEQLQNMNPSEFSTASMEKSMDYYLTELY